MTIIDDRGRLFGRINLVDGAVAVFVLAAIPLAYGTYLLFQPVQPRIDSVSPSLVTREERRISAGGRLTAKFKVKGTGFTPMLRARIGETDAIGFVFENPNSADVLVGPVPPGAHDLVLIDGMQEVARATGAITVEPDTGAFVRGVGWLTDLDAGLIQTLRAGLAFPESAPAFEIIALGPLRPARARVQLGGGHLDLPREGLQEREAVLNLRCTSSAEDNPCAMTETSQPVMVSLAGPSRYFGFTVYELVPATKPSKARVRVRLAQDAPVSMIRSGDRDHFLDERAAVVIGVAREGNASIVTLELGADDSREGWRYRQQRLAPGAPFVFGHERYVAGGTVASITLIESPGAPK